MRTTTPDDTDAMTTTVPTFTGTRFSRLASGGFAIQALVSLVVWFVVNDMSRGRGVVYNEDFGEWVGLSLASSVVLLVLVGLGLRRRLAVLAVAVGCGLAVTAGIAVLVGWVLLGSA